MTIFISKLIFLFKNVILIWICDFFFHFFFRIFKFRIDLETEHNHVVNIVVFGFNMI